MTIDLIVLCGEEVKQQWCQKPKSQIVRNKGAWVWATISSTFTAQIPHETHLPCQERQQDGLSLDLHQLVKVLGDFGAYWVGVSSSRFLQIPCMTDGVKVWDAG